MGRPSPKRMVSIRARKVKQIVNIGKRLVNGVDMVEIQVCDGFANVKVLKK
ncbi:unnamed protein product [marine sediment metagenome]|uniref:Uncharacterized protein n=1 Tax=marine sediment metagenome TaxID=412755 RepID=X1MDY6_9ZZZZ